MSEKAIIILLIPMLLLTFFGNSVCECSELKSRVKREIFGSVDLEKVRKSVLSPSTISNQLTGALIFPFFTEPIGYAILGKTWLKIFINL